MQILAGIRPQFRRRSVLVIAKSDCRTWAVHAWQSRRSASAPSSEQSPDPLFTIFADDAGLSA
jgi:hypothetical protein